MRIISSLFILAMLLSCSVKKEENTNTWYKGNTHCHSIISDGDSAPNKVVAAYHNQGYNFMLLTDHNFLVNMDTVLMPANLREDFLLIPGEELTDHRSVHTTAFNISEYVPYSNDPQNETDPKKRREEIIASLKEEVAYTSTELLQLHVDRVQEKGGICFLNHPNFANGLQVEDIYPVSNLTHLELYNGHPSVANWGKEGHISVEDKWDTLLSKGRLIYGVASDDMHRCRRDDPGSSSLFKGWIMVQADELTTEKIHQSVLHGDFYASTSVILSKCEKSKKEYTVEIDEIKTKWEIEHACGVPRIDATGEEGYTIEFIGSNGKVLKKVNGLSATYKPVKEDIYVRARVTHSTKTEKGFEKLFAWTQPIVIDDTKFNL